MKFLVTGVAENSKRKPDEAQDGEAPPPTTNFHYLSSASFREHRGEIERQFERFKIFAFTDKIDKLGPLADSATLVAAECQNLLMFQKQKVKD